MTNALIVTPLYAGILGLFYLFLSLRVVNARRVNRIGFGDGGDRDLTRRRRAHGNFAEYAPFVLVLMGFAELQGAPAALLHGIGLALTAGRLVHGFGISREPEFIPLRVAGTMLTLAALAAAAVTTLVLAVGRV